MDISSFQWPIKFKGNQDRGHWQFQWRLGLEPSQELDFQVWRRRSFVTYVLQSHSGICLHLPHLLDSISTPQASGNSCASASAVGRDEVSPLPHQASAESETPVGGDRHTFGLSQALAVDGQKHIWDNISGDALAVLSHYPEYKEARIEPISTLKFFRLQF